MSLHRLFHRLRACAPLLAVLTLPALPSLAAPPPVRDGDLLFHTSRSAQSVAVQQATGSRYSHMGVVLMHDGQPSVLEASATVRRTPLAQWLARGEQGHYVLKRLRTPLTSHQVSALRRGAAQFEGRPYDLAFEWSDQRIYCSELVWKLYHRALGIDIGRQQPLRDFHLATPAVRAKLRERYGARVPLDEPVISPVAMFDSPLLVTVASH